MIRLIIGETRMERDLLARLVEARGRVLEAEAAASEDKLTVAMASGALVRSCKGADKLRERLRRKWRMELARERRIELLGTEKRRLEDANDELRAKLAEASQVDTVKMADELRQARKSLAYFGSRCPALEQQIAEERDRHRGEIAAAHDRHAAQVVFVVGEVARLAEDVESYKASWLAAEKRARDREDATLHRECEAVSKLVHGVGSRCTTPDPTVLLVCQYCEDYDHPDQLSLTDGQLAGLKAAGQWIVGDRHRSRLDARLEKSWTHLGICPECNKNKAVNQEEKP